MCVSDGLLVFSADSRFQSSSLLVESPFLYFLDNRCLNESSWQPHQSVLLPAEDHLVMERHVSKVLGYRESAQAVTRVVEISGSEDRIRHNKEHVGDHVNGIWLESGHEFVCVCVQMVWDWLARLIQQAPCWVLTAQEDVLLQGLLLKHPSLLTQLRLPCSVGGVLKHRVNYRSEQEKTSRQIATCGNL